MPGTTAAITTPQGRHLLTHPLPGPTAPTTGVLPTHMATDTATLSKTATPPAHQSWFERRVVSHADQLRLNPKVLAAALPVGEVAKWGYRGAIVSKELITISKTAGIRATIDDVGVHGLAKELGPNLAKGYVHSVALHWGVVGGTVLVAAGVYQYQHRFAPHQPAGSHSAH